MSLLIVAMIIVAALVLLLCQGGGDGVKPADDLLPGEVRSTPWKKPIIVAAGDTECSNEIGCPSRAADCVRKTFTVQKDTTYYLTLYYSNGDTLTPSCRLCGTVYQDTTVVMNLVTACPTGGPWVETAILKPGITYTLAVCLQRCPDLPECRCGELIQADAVISMRHMLI